MADTEADARIADDVLTEHRLELMRRHRLAFLAGASVERGEVWAAAELRDAAAVPMNLTPAAGQPGLLRCAQHRPRARRRAHLRPLARCSPGAP